jgi:hypothetical protein
MWAQDRDDIPPNSKSIISSQLMTVSVDFARCDFVSRECLPQGQKYNSQFFTQTVLPSINRKLTGCRPKLRETAAHLDIDNAKLLTSIISIQKIEELGLI